MRALALLLLLFAPATVPSTASAQSIDWTPPAVGTKMVYELLLGDQAFEADIEVLGIENGDLVRTRVTTLGQSANELSLRSVVNIESSAGQFQFDFDEARALWPLEPGKSVNFAGTGQSGGQNITFDATLSVETIEQVEVPAGSFLSARIGNVTNMVVAGQSLTLETQQWVDSESGLPVKTSITVTSGGQLLQTVTMTAVEGPSLP